MRNGIFYGMGGLLLIASSSVSAALIDFNYNNLAIAGGATLSSVNMSVEGIDVDVTAFTVVNDGAGNIFSLDQVVDQNTGVFVSTSASGNLGVRSSSIDGSLLDGGNSADDLDEGLLFSFSEIVSFDYINFDYFTDAGGDDFNLTVDGVTILWDVNANNSASFSPLISNVAGEFDEYNFSGITGQNFLIWADGDSDSFRVDWMSVNTVSAVNSVPEPGVILLFGIGLIGLFFRDVKRV